MLVNREERFIPVRLSGWMPVGSWPRKLAKSEPNIDGQAADDLVRPHRHAEEGVIREGRPHRHRHEEGEEEGAGLDGGETGQGTKQIVPP